MDRRLFLGGAAGGLAAFLKPLEARAAPPPRFTADPFALGVASGDPSADGVVLWTRICPDPFDPEALAGKSFEVSWQVAADASFKRIVRAGVRLAAPERGHAIHVDLYGLEPDRDYWYRFETGGVQSPVGRAVTLPAPHAPKDRVKFAWASCQHYEQGLFTAYRDMVAGDPRLILHTGDYIYEAAPSWGPQHRRHPTANPRTLDEYRLQHAVYKLDPDLRAAHAHTSWAFVWDDHEVSNNYAGLTPQRAEDEAGFPARRAAAYRAYLENLPISRRALLGADGVQLYQRLAFGDLIDFLMLDTRQYRSAPVAQSVAYAGRGGPERTVLGEGQERWLSDQLAHDQARWTALVQTTMFARMFMRDASGIETGSIDSWDGYPGARQLITDLLTRRRASNPVFLGGDVHAFYANDVRADFSKPDSPVVATEFVGTSISSQAYGYDTYSKVAAGEGNAHIRFYDDRRRGYARAEVTKDAFAVEFRQIDSVWTQAPRFETMRRFAAAPGRPGVQAG